MYSFKYREFPSKNVALSSEFWSRGTTLTNEPATLETHWRRNLLYPESVTKSAHVLAYASGDRILVDTAEQLLRLKWTSVLH